MSHIWQDPKDINKAHLATMIKLAGADGKLSPHENIFIKTLAMRLGINDIEFKTVLEKLKTTEPVVPNDPTERNRLFFQLMTLVNIDQEQHDEELKFCKEIASTFNIEADKAAEVFALMAQKIAEQVSFEEVNALLTSTS